MWSRVAPALAGGLFLSLIVVCLDFGGGGLDDRDVLFEHYGGSNVDPTMPGPLTVDGNEDVSPLHSGLAADFRVVA